MNARLLVIEDDKNAGSALQTLLRREGYEVDLCRDGQSGLDQALETPYDLVLTDIVMPGLDGMTVFKELHAKNPDTPILIMTAHGNITMAVEAMRDGATDFFEKPLDIDRVRFQVAKALERQQLLKENQNLKLRLGETYALKNLIGDSPEMRKLAQQVLQVAPTRASILLLGESGTGKELVANAIHENSPRSDKPFIKINCAALPDELLQSELFGHVKGAFTGAHQTRKGRFEEAHGGTLFLDEIGDLPLSMQVKLLRVLQEGTFERIGDNNSLHTDVRLITATHVNLEKAIEKGTLREDFYYRIKGITLSLPPLRERTGDIPLLAHYFLNQAEGPGLRLSTEALEAMMQFPWQGNVRQLKNICDNLSILANSETINLEDLPEELRSGKSSRSSIMRDPGFEFMSLPEAEVYLIRKALKQTGGNKTEAARQLGIGLRTLYRKLDKMGLDN